MTPKTNQTRTFAILVAVLVSLSNVDAAFAERANDANDEAYDAVHYANYAEEGDIVIGGAAGSAAGKVVGKTAGWAAKKAGPAIGNVFTSAKEMMASKTGTARGGNQGSIRNIKPDFYGTVNKEIVPVQTPQGREITPHAADRMANPPKGRVPMTPNEVDAIIDKNVVRKTNYQEGTITYWDQLSPGRPQVAISDDGSRIVTVIKKEPR